ncbi:hypothetical protein ACFL2F_05005, partial [Myxococcota bacterium]
MRKALFPILIVFLAAACHEEPNTPEGSYYAFYQALTERDWDTAVQYLSADTLEAFRHVGGRLKRFVGSQKDPLTVFLRGTTADAVRPLRRVEVVSREAGRAVLKVTAGPCGEGEQCLVSQVNLRKEGNRWVICPKLPSLFLKGEPK